MHDPRDVAYGELKGMLEAFARFNDCGDLQYAFAFDWLPDGADVKQSVSSHLGREVGNWTLVDSWEATVRETLARWIFQYQGVVSKRLIHTGKKYDFVYPGEGFYLNDEQFRGQLIDGLITRLSLVVAPTVVWLADESMWTGLAFESPSGSYLLGFGVSD